MNSFRGYISSRDCLGVNYPQRIQNIVIRDYCNNNKFEFLLSAAEYSMKGSYFVLKDIIKELPVISGVVAFSIFQLPDSKSKRIDLLNIFIENKKSIHFALERFSVKSYKDMVKLNQIWQIKKTTNNKNKQPWKNKK
jgi:sporadic carbohydrate cluster protein (TIGR04323 family)